MTDDLLLHTVPAYDASSAELDPRRDKRSSLKHRHSQSLARLMDERTDLRGVHALADFVDEQLRWSA